MFDTIPQIFRSGSMPVLRKGEMEKLHAFCIENKNLFHAKSNSVSHENLASIKELIKPSFT